MAEVDATLFDEVVALVGRAWSNATRWRVDDRIAEQGMRRQNSLVTVPTQRVLVRRSVLLVRGEPSGPTVFWVAPDVLAWCANELDRPVFVVAGPCLAGRCRCSGLAGARVSSKRRPILSPPLHVDCACFLASSAVLDADLSKRLRSLAEVSNRMRSSGSR